MNTYLVHMKFNVLIGEGRQVSGCARMARTKQSAVGRGLNTPYTSVMATNNLAFLRRVNDLIMVTPNLNSAVGSLGSKPADDAIQGVLVALSGRILRLLKISFQTGPF